MRRVPTTLFEQIGTIIAPVNVTSAQRKDFDETRSILQAYTGSLEAACFDFLCDGFCNALACVKVLHDSKIDHKT